MMGKTLIEVAGYLKEILVPETQETYRISATYANLLPEDTIRKGVTALRAFLEKFYLSLCEKGELYDKKKKVAHENENRISLSYYPFLYNINIILIRMGYFGVLEKDNQTLVCDGRIFNKKITVPKNLECLRFLTECGICIEGLDLNDKKQDLSVYNIIKITYPEHPDMVAGLKIMSIAEVEHRTLVNQDVLMRCDYRVLKEDDTEVLSIVQQTIRPLPQDIQDFIVELHNRYLHKGLTCVVEVKGFHIHIMYCLKRKELWGINASLSNGYHINIKTTKTSEYVDTVKKFSPVLQEMINKGYGCGRKRETGRCDGGCHGMKLSLDKSVLELKNDIIEWFDNEVEYSQKKKHIK